MDKQKSTNCPEHAPLANLASGHLELDIKQSNEKKLILMRFKLTSPPTLFIQPHSTFIVSNEIWRKIDQDKILFRLLVIPFSSLITFCLVANSMQIMIIFIHKSTHIASWAENRTKRLQIYSQTSDRSYREHVYIRSSLWDLKNVTNLFVIAVRSLLLWSL